MGTFLANPPSLQMVRISFQFLQKFHILSQLSFLSERFWKRGASIRNMIRSMPVWKPLKHDPKAVALLVGVIFVATKLFITGRAAPSPNPTHTLAANTAGSV